MNFNTDHFLRKIAKNEVSNEEQIAFRKWLLNLTPQQQEQVLNKFELIHADITADQKFEPLPLPNINYQEKKKQIKYYAVAATISILLIAFFGLLIMLRGPKVTEFQSNSKGKTMNLEDGTAVKLMPNSSLKVSFNEDFRNIELTGEAVFKVKKDKKRPMIVTTEGVTTTVLGTTFHIKQSDRGLLVNLIEGSIKMNHNNLENIIAPGQQWYLDRSHNKSYLFEAKSTDFNEVKFENEPLEKIIAYIEMRYNVDFSFNKKDLQECKISITLGNSPLLTSLELIEFATALKFDRSDNYFKVSGKCN